MFYNQLIFCDLCIDKLKLSTLYLHHQFIKKIQYNMSIAVYSIINNKGNAVIKLATPLHQNCKLLSDINGKWERKQKIWFVPYSLQNINAITSNFKEVIRVGEVISIQNDLIPVRG